MKLLLQELTQCWTDSDNEGHCFHQKQMLERTGQQKSLLWYGLKFLLFICRGCDVYMYINSHLITRKQQVVLTITIVLLEYEATPLSG